MDCIFCKIANGELPSTKVYETESVLAFHDIQKVAPVHVLVIPKVHMENILGLDPTDTTLLGELQRAIREVATLTGVAQTGFRLVTNAGSSAGQTVFHLHYHIIGGRSLEVSLG